MNKQKIQNENWINLRPPRRDISGIIHIVFDEVEIGVVIVLVLGVFVIIVIVVAAVVVHGGILCLATVEVVFDGLDVIGIVHIVLGVHGRRQPNNRQEREREDWRGIE
jgi:hypothetical protein